MNKPDYLQQLSVLLFTILFATSCTQEGELEKSRYLFNEYSVDRSEIEAIASGIKFPMDESSNLKSTGDQTKNICSIDEMKNSIGETSFYIVNYDEGGFVLLSADKRATPILGFSLTNRFEVDENIYPPGLKFWMGDATEQIEALQQSSFEQSPSVEAAWELVQQSLVEEISSFKLEPPPDCYEHTEITIVGPLGAPTWEQRNGYNAALDTITCSGSDYQVSVGCMPLAMAMVMWIHESPSSYSWSSMPDDTASSTTADFLRDVHDEINDEYSYLPVYSCTYGTGIGTADMADVFKDQFGYSNAITDDYDYNTVESNIDNDRPVILSGFDATEGGHSWVCDGYRQSNYYYEDCSMVSLLHFHMVWGAGITNVGWYAYNNFNPGNLSYNNDKSMIYNIIP